MSQDTSKKATDQVRGDEAVIREFVEWMKTSLEGFLNRGEGSTRYVNVFMGMINFNRVVLQDLEERLCDSDRRSRIAFRLAFLQTLHDSMIRLHPPTDAKVVNG